MSASDLQSELDESSNDSPTEDSASHAFPLEEAVELKRSVLGRVITHPCGCFFVASASVLMVVISIYYILNPLSTCLDTDFSDFQVIGSDVVEHYYISKLLSDSSVHEFINGQSSRRRRRLSSTASDVTGRTWDSHDYSHRRKSHMNLYVFYYDPNGYDVLTGSKMKTAHTIEAAIKSFDGYDQRCLLYKSGHEYIESTPDSFLNNLFPSQGTSDDGSDSWVLDGNGDELCCNPKDTAVSLVKSDSEYYDYFDHSFSISNVGKNRSSKYLASVYKFGYKRNETKTGLEAWIQTYDSLLSKFWARDGKHGLGLAYTDSEGLILHQQLMNYVYSDLQLALVSVALIFVVVYLYVRSLFLTVFGLLGVCASFAPAMMIFKLVYGDVFSIVNVCSVWVILGIGADDIFVFMASYRRAPLVSATGGIVPHAERMSFAYREAGTAMFCTSFTTGCSFASLMFSSISPLPQFGFFMTTLVAMNFLLVMTWYPCCVQLYVWCVQRGAKSEKCGYCRHCVSGGDCCGGSNKCRDCTWLAVPVAVERRGNDALNAVNAVSVSNIDPLDDEDVSLPPQDNGKCLVYQTQASNMMRLRQVMQSGRYSFLGVPNFTCRAHSHPSQEEHEWGCLVRTYWSIQRFTGIVVILATLAMVGFLAFSVTKISVPSSTPQLLPSWTNMGRVEKALDVMDVCQNCQTTGSATKATSVSSFESYASQTTTPRPTPRPTPPTPAPVPTPKPTPRPTTRATAPPTERPTKTPSNSPSLSPTTLFPTSSPSLGPSPSPTLFPTDASEAPTSISFGPDTTEFEPAVTISFSTTLPDVSTISSYPTLPSYVKLPQAPTALSAPTTSPTSRAPTTSPSAPPTPSPTLAPVATPSLAPTIAPSAAPTAAPSAEPTTHSPTRSPTARSTDLPLEESVKVYLVFGGKSASNYGSDCEGEVVSDATLELDTNFDIYDPGTQQKGLWLCEELAAISDSVMYRRSDQYPCLWKQFYNWAYRGLNNSDGTLLKSWPETNRTRMEAAVEQWILKGPGSEYTSNFGIDADSYKVTWMKQFVGTQVNKKWGASMMNKYYQKWEKFMDRFNKNNSMYAGVNKFEGFEYASNWVYMEVELAFLKGFYKSVGYTLILCTGTMLVFTRNIAIVLLVCAYIVMIVVCVVGTYGAMDWEFGVIEVIAVPTVVGLSIDYSLHVTHSYVHSIYRDRKRRARAAVGHIGGSVFASAMTTISSMVAMYFAVVCIFSNLALIVATTASTGIFVSIFVCPPLLAYIGPQGEQCDVVVCCKKCCGSWKEKVEGMDPIQTMERKVETAKSKIKSVGNGINLNVKRMGRTGKEDDVGKGVELTARGIKGMKGNKRLASRYEPLVAGADEAASVGNDASEMLVIEAGDTDMEQDDMSVLTSDDANGSEYSRVR